MSLFNEKSLKFLEIGGNIMIASIFFLIFVQLAPMKLWAMGYEGPQASVKQNREKDEFGFQDKIKKFVPGVHDFLVKYLKDNNLYVRLSAVVVLEEIEDPESVPGLIEVCVEAMGNESYYIRLVASNILLKLENPDKFPMVPEACVKAFYDEYTPVQLNATNIVRKIEDPSKIPGIYEACRHALEEDCHPVRQNAMAILGRIRDQKNRKIEENRKPQNNKE